MVRALLENRKAQTRRAIPSEWGDYQRTSGTLACNWESKTGRETWLFNDYHRCPYGQPGDRLWVRETWQNGLPLPDGKSIPHYRADRDQAQLDAYTGNWRPSIFMPRWASRITLEIESVRVERLQEISEGDAYAEGIEVVPEDFYSQSGEASRKAYKRLWESINGDKSWSLNPWVWKIPFSRV